MKGIVTILSIAAIALLLPGLINRTRAFFAGRKGVVFFQHIFNLRAMLRKGVVTGHTSTLIFRTAPSVYLGAVLTAAFVIPFGNFPALLHFKGDLVMFAYLLAAGRMSLILAALDMGSSFEGMGASRDALYGAMAEPVLFLTGGTLALISGKMSFSSIFPVIGSGSWSLEYVIILLLLMYVILRLISIECRRMPVDDPRTHLELTMIHEVMILDYSGIDLAMITAGGWIKMAVLAALAGNVGAAVTGNGYAGAVLFSALTAVAIGITESFSARNKMSRNTTYIFTVVAIAFVLFMVSFLLRLNIDLT